MEAAIVIVGYKRKRELLRLLISVKEANYDHWNPTLIISIDKSEIENEILLLLETFEWPYGEKIIRTFKERQGLKQHVLQCGDLAEKYGAVIVLEDDLLVSPEYYRYAMKALSFYQNNERVAGIALYSHKRNGYARAVFEPVNNGYDTYWGCFGVSWGQCWTDKQWKAFRDWFDTSPELEAVDEIPPEVLAWGENSWGKYFNYYTVIKRKYYIIPYISLSTCFSEEGEHTKVESTEYQVPLLQGEKKCYSFAEYENAVRYDMFFENEGCKNFFDENIWKDGICVDLYGVKKKYAGCRYLLSTAFLNYKIISSFGLKMRPMELNIMHGIEGEGIYLYDMSCMKKNEKRTNKNKLYYEMAGGKWKDTLRYTLYELGNKIRRKINRK